MFLLGKVLVVKILMNPTKMGLPVKFNERMTNNFKLIASVLYYNYIEYVTTLTEKVAYGPDNKGSDGISLFLIP